MGGRHCNHRKWKVVPTPVKALASRKVLKLSLSACLIYTKWNNQRHKTKLCDHKLHQMLPLSVPCYSNRLTSRILTKVFSFCSNHSEVYILQLLPQPVSGTDIMQTTACR